jgi:hypothetical protein
MFASNLSILILDYSNHFRQSYMMQAHKVLYPVFARMGVKLITRNMAQGGLGTVQAGMGLGSIYGDDIDLLLWDSGKMADDNSSGGNADGDDECKDFFRRQTPYEGGFRHLHEC